MRTFRIVFVALATAGGMLAQEPPAPAQTPPPSVPKPVLPILPGAFRPAQPTISRCSIPLMEALIPKGVDFKLKQIAPPTEKLAPIPQVKGPAPACESWSVR